MFIEVAIDQLIPNNQHNKLSVGILLLVEFGLLYTYMSPQPDSNQHKQITQWQTSKK